MHKQHHFEEYILEDYHQLAWVVRIVLKEQLLIKVIFSTGTLKILLIFSPEGGIEDQDET